jgi:hypothetical protein
MIPSILARRGLFLRGGSRFSSSSATVLANNTAFTMMSCKSEIELKKVIQDLQEESTGLVPYQSASNAILGSSSLIYRLFSHIQK